jgi:hypothetical protein
MLKWLATLYSAMFTLSSSCHMGKLPFESLQLILGNLNICVKTSAGEMLMSGYFCHLLQDVAFDEFFAYFFFNFIYL